MLFTFDITIPAGTPEESPVIETLKLSAGVLTHASIKFPAGCNGYVKARLLIQENQMMPIPRGEWIIADDEAVQSDYYLEMLKKPQELEFHGCSPNADYDHNLNVRVTVLPREVATFLPVIEAFTKFLRKLGLVS